MVAVAYERCSLTRGSKYSDLTWKLGILDDWSLRRGGRLREVVVTGGSTVYIESNKRQCFIGKRVEKYDA